MNKRKEATIYTTGCHKVTGFSELIEKFKKTLSVLGKSESTFKNYSLHVSAMAQHFETLPTELDEEQITDYHYFLQQQHNTPSLSYIKHTIYGLRALFKMEGIKPSEVGLPSIFY